MNAEQTTMVNELLSYLYGSFLVTYVLCVIGLLIKEVLYNASDNKKRPSPISIKRVIFASIPVTAIICAAKDKFDMSFSMYVLICLMGGTCSGFICNVLINNNLPLILIKAIAKAVKDPMMDAISETAEQVSKKISEEENKDNDDTSDVEEVNNNTSEVDIENEENFQLQEEEYSDDQETKKEEPV